jgi:hypothetical protein
MTDDRPVGEPAATVLDLAFDSGTVAARRCPECTADITPGVERPRQVSV